MTITFNEIPSNLREPAAPVEIDSSQAQRGPNLLAYRALILGQRRTAVGSAVNNTLYRVTSPADVIALAGQGSLLHRQAIAWFAQNKVTETWIAVLGDDGAGVAATGTIALTGPATAEGTFPLYVGGYRVPVAVTVGMTATQLGDAIAAAITALPDLPVTAANVTGTVTFTFRHKGLTGNGYPISVSYRDDDRIPAGIVATITAMGGVVAGTTAPALATVIAAMAEQWFHVIANPYTDATNLGVIEVEMADRFQADRSMPGVAVASAIGTFGTLTTLGGARNSPHSAIFAQAGSAPVTPAFEFSAETAAIIARYGSIDPARPLQTLPYKHSLPPAKAGRFTYQERNLLLFDGIATTLVEGETPQVSRAITTYQRNPAAADDDAYLRITTMLTLLYLRYDWNTRLRKKFPRHKLADDGTKFGAGQIIMTPKQGRAEALAWYEEKIEQGLCENLEQFEADLLVERNLSDADRLDFGLAPNLINELVIMASKISFRL